MQQTIFAPCLRTSPLYIPRRDLVLSAADSLTLRVTVVESDDPNAQQVVITGGIGGPAAQLVIWQDQCRPGGWWDYQAPPTAGGTILWSGTGTPQAGLGSFDWFLPPDTLRGFPRRCGWAVQMGLDANTMADTLLYGRLNIAGQFGSLAVGVDGAGGNLLTDTGIPVLTGTSINVEV